MTKPIITEDSFKDRNGTLMLDPVDIYENSQIVTLDRRSVPKGYKGYLQSNLKKKQEYEEWKALQSNQSKKDEEKTSHIAIKPEVNPTIKFVIVGDGNVGKTAIIQRYLKDEFTNKYTDSKSLYDWESKNIVIDSKKINLQIVATSFWNHYTDCPGVEARGADVVFYVFDVNNAKSFEAIDNKYISEVGSHNHNSSPKSILIGTKIDADTYRAVSTKRAQAFAEAKGMTYFEVSAKENINIKEVFEFGVRLVLADLNNNTLIAYEDISKFAKTIQQDVCDTKFNHWSKQGGLFGYKTPNHIKQLQKLLDGKKIEEETFDNCKDLVIEMVKILIDAKDDDPWFRKKGTLNFYMDELTTGLKALQMTEEYFRATYISNDNLKIQNTQ